MPDERVDPERLDGRLGHRFRDRELLARALTHASARDAHNERLEFLGDAVLDLVVAEALYFALPGKREGELTELKALLVSRDTLERVGRRLGLEEWIETGRGLAGRGSLPRSVLGNAVEALLGAVYLDLEPPGRLAGAARVAWSWLLPEMPRLARELVRSRAKPKLQAWAQRERGCLPAYPLLDSFHHPETHAFLVAAEVAGRRFPAAWGSSKKDAERFAAWEALMVLEREGALPPPREEPGA
ncbi:MAG: ribonuclease III [Planctomycetota bacterium]|nr:MAG: ribonuclease III [Planctomycetota bacterium]